MTFTFRKILKVPWHSPSSQERSSVRPSQFLPPYLGSGKSHFLSLYCTSLPQDTLQTEYSDQFPKAPFTGHGLIKDLRVSVCYQYNLHRYLQDLGYYIFFYIFGFQDHMIVSNSNSWTIFQILHQSVLIFKKMNSKIPRF